MCDIVGGVIFVSFFGLNGGLLILIFFSGWIIGSSVILLLVLCVNELFSVLVVWCVGIRIRYWVNVLGFVLMFSFCCSVFMIVERKLVLGGILKICGEGVLNSWIVKFEFEFLFYYGYWDC